MSWMSQLYRVYENSIKNEERDESSITPIAHMNANAQIQITIDREGNFLGAKKLDKKDGVTLIPVTEKSRSGRTSGISPHGLCDTLSFIAGDFEEYCREKRSVAHNKYIAYMSNLKRWVESDFSHSQARAVYKYLEKKEVILDLIKSGIITIQEDGKFCDKKISGQSYEKALVRFVIVENNYKIRGETWKDVDLIEAYTQYYISTQDGRCDVCYLTGQEQIISEKHPSGIVNASPNAKVMSSNDTTEWTYRGRFQNAAQASSLSYEASQKIHSALTWLIKKQGVTIGTQEKRTFVCWNPSGKEVPNVFDMFGPSLDEDANDAVAMRSNMWKTLKGYAGQFEADDEIIVMSLDAATTGRLSITYYNELPALDFLSRVERWAETCKWYYRKWSQQKKPYIDIETPTFARIIKCAFGTQQGSFIDVNDKVLKEHVQRLLKCMLESQPIPLDLVQALVRKASSPSCYTEGNRELVLSTACALVAKNQYDRYGQKKGEESLMKLDIQNRDRSYLFGRLLAVLEKAERITYEFGEGREPNAIRLQSAYVNHPMQTWKILEEAVKPYFQKMHPGTREKYRSLISEIVCLLPEDDKTLNCQLSENYLLGYYLQRAELNVKKAEDKNTNKEEM